MGLGITRFLHTYFTLSRTRNKLLMIDVDVAPVLHRSRRNNMFSAIESLFTAGSFSLNFMSDTPSQRSVSK